MMHLMLALSLMTAQFIEAGSPKPEASKFPGGHRSKGPFPSRDRIFMAETATFQSDDATIRE